MGKNISSLVGGKVKQPAKESDTIKARMSSEQEILTLTIVYKHPKVLLGFKKRGWGEGRWNGFGGKVNDGESVKEAAKRELKEESGVDAMDIKESGELDFDFKDSGKKFKVFVFRASEFSGEPKETEEMRPKWFFIDEIPFREMWADDVYWMPLFFKGHKFKGEFSFADQNTLLDRKIEIL